MDDRNHLTHTNAQFHKQLLEVQLNYYSLLVMTGLLLSSIHGGQPSRTEHISIILLTHHKLLVRKKWHDKHHMVSVSQTGGERNHVVFSTGGGKGIGNNESERKKNACNYMYMKFFIPKLEKIFQLNQKNKFS